MAAATDDELIERLARIYEQIRDLTKEEQKAVLMAAAILIGNKVKQ